MLGGGVEKKARTKHKTNEESETMGGDNATKLMSMCAPFGE